MANTEATNQYAAFQGDKGNRGARGSEGGTRVQVTPERKRKKSNNEARAKSPHKENPAARVPLIKVKRPTSKIIAIAKQWEDMNAGKWDLEEEDVKDLT